MLTLRTTKIVGLTDRISEIHFESADGAALPDWTAGAHIDFDTPQGPRSYSLIRWPGDAASDYVCAIQREDDGTGGSAAMHALTPGQTIKATSPTNDFELVNQDRPVALLAGGIGITPLVSMATELKRANRAFTLHYAGRTAPQMAYLEKLKDVFRANIISHFDDETPLDLSQLMPDLADHSLYICGPKGMIEAARTAAEAVGISPDHIHVELFTTPAPVSTNTPFEVEIASSGQVIRVDANQSIIEALEAAGVDVMYDCQRGDCGICQTDIVDGLPDHRDVVLSQSEKETGKVMQICVSRALSPRLVLDL